MDGASELRIFTRIALPMMVPGLVTVFLFQFVAIWNNFLLPYIMLSDDEKFPITLGLFTLLEQGANTPALYTLVITGALLAIIPLIALFLVIQRFWSLDLRGRGRKVVTRGMTPLGGRRAGRSSRGGRRSTTCAREAGVSRGTVSRVLNGGHYVSPAAQEAVNAAIRRTGYVVNRHARSLITGRSRLGRLPAHRAAGAVLRGPQLSTSCCAAAARRWPRATSRCC